MSSYLNGHGVPSATSSTTIGGVSEHIADLWARHDDLKLATVKRTVLIEEVIARYETLAQTYEDTARRLEEERGYNASYHAIEAKLRQNLTRMQFLLNRNPFIAVVIDGDGMIFSHVFLRDGEKGGRQAAAALKTQLAKSFENINSDSAGECKILVRVYANVRGLAEICTKAGLIDNPTQLEDFVRGFTRSDTLFDFIDVGSGNDRADTKVIDNFKLFLFDYHCRQILVGCSHDDGYARALEEHIDSEEVRHRVTLLEGVPFEKELAQLPFKTTKFPGIFRSSKINVTFSDLFTGNGARRDAFGAIGTASTSRTTPVPRHYSNASSDAVSPMGTVRSSNSTSPAVGTWAQRATAAVDLPETVEVPKPTQDSFEVVRRNKKGQRIDPVLAYDLSELTRIKKLKLCNQHYLGPNGCHKSTKCHHMHTYKPTDAELKTLRSVSRETPCKKGTECEEMGCIYGHRCPFPMATEGTMRGIGCLMGDTCRFPREMHGITDSTPVKYTRVTGLF